MTWIILSGIRLASRTSRETRGIEVMPIKTLKHPLPAIVVIVDVALSLSAKADTVRTLSTERSESKGEHVLLSRVASGHPVIQREHR